MNFLPSAAFCEERLKYEAMEAAVKKLFLRRDNYDTTLARLRLK